MSVDVIDCRKMACPQPVIETKKALEKRAESTIVILVDNVMAKENVTRFARNAGCKVELEEKRGCFQLSITRPAGEISAIIPDAKDLPQCDGSAGTVYFITSNALGQGSPDLGEVLMKSLMVTMVEQQPPPVALLFLNTGVFLSVEGSPVLEQLQKLAAAGTEIMVCGTCLNYYKVKEKLAVGVVSNMYKINSSLTGSHKVVTVG